MLDFMKCSSEHWTGARKQNCETDTISACCSCWNGNSFSDRAADSSVQLQQSDDRASEHCTGVRSGMENTIGLRHIRPRLVLILH